MILLLFFLFFNILLLVKAQLQGQYKQYFVINYANATLITFNY